MRTIPILILISILYSCNTGSNDTGLKYNSTEDSLALVKMVNERETAMKKKDIHAVMAQFSDDATFINGEGYYCANKAEIEGPIQGLSDELIEGILFFTDKNDQVSTRLVSRRWNILTLNAKFPIKQDLNQFFRLLADNRR